MFILNSNAAYDTPLDSIDAETLGLNALATVRRFLEFRQDNSATPLHSLSSLAHELGVASIHIKDEGYRLGLGSFKALGGSYAVIRLVLEEASRKLGRVRLRMRSFTTPRGTAASALPW